MSQLIKKEGINQIQNQSQNQIQKSHYDSKQEIRRWLHSYKKNQPLTTSPVVFESFVNKHEETRLFCLNLYKVNNIESPTSEDLKIFEYSLKFTVTIFDIQTSQFSSRTYHSASIPLIFKEQGLDLEGDVKDNSFNNNEYRIVISEFNEIEEHKSLNIIEENSQEEKSPNKQVEENFAQEDQFVQEESQYYHDPVWVGFYGTQQVKIAKLQAIIEITQYKHEQKKNSVQHCQTLGHVVIPLDSYQQENIVYKGTTNEMLHSCPKRQAGQMNLEADFQVFDNQTEELMALIGKYNLFGQDDRVFGLIDHSIPRDPIGLKDVVISEQKVVVVSNLQISIHKAVELELIDECNELYLQKFRQMNPTHNQIQSFCMNTVQIVCHNGWKAINSKDFENKFILAKMDASRIPQENNQKQNVYNHYCMTDLKAVVDNSLQDCIILFQIIFEAEFIVNVLGRQTLQMYVGWIAVPVNMIFRQDGEIHIGCDLMSGVGQSFDRKGYFSKTGSDSPGFIKAKISFVEKYKNDKFQPGANEQTLFESKVIAGSVFKEMLISKSKKRKEDIKLGIVKDYIVDEQQLKLESVQQAKMNNFSLVESLFQTEDIEHQRRQTLAGECTRIIQQTELNLKVQEERYQLKQHRLYNYKERREQLKIVEHQKYVEKQKKFDDWVFDGNQHPYDLQEYLKQTKFGSKQIPLPDVEKLLIRSNGIFKDAYSMYQNYLQGLLIQQLYYYKIMALIRSNTYDNKIMKVEIEFQSFTPILSIPLKYSKDQYDIPTIYGFENPIPSSLFFCVHILGQKEIWSKRVVFSNGSNLQTFNNTMVNLEPLYLINNHNNLPVKLQVTLPEQILFGKYAIIEIWNGYTHTLFGKIYSPLQTSRLGIQSQSQSGHSSPSQSPQHIAPQFYQALSRIQPRKDKNHRAALVSQNDIDIQEENIKLRSKLLPIVVCTSCDIISPQFDLILGTIELCILITEAKEKDNIVSSSIDVKIQHKTKILSTSTMPLTQKVNKDQISKNMVRILDQINQIDGFGTQIFKEEPIIDDTIRLTVIAGDELFLSFPQPLIFKINLHRHQLQQIKSMALFCKDFESIKLDSYDLFTVNIRSMIPLKKDQTIKSYLVAFKDKEQLEVLYITKIFITALHCFSFTMTQGQVIRGEIALQINKRAIIRFKTTRPKQIVIPEYFLEENQSVPGLLFKIPLDLFSYTETPTLTQFTCISTSDSDQWSFPVQSYLISFKPSFPNISLLYDLKCRMGVKEKNSILYKNLSNKKINLKVRASHQQVEILSPQITYQQNEVKPIQCLFQTEFLLKKLQVKIFLHDEESSFFDCIMLRIQYTE